MISFSAEYEKWVVIILVRRSHWEGDTRGYCLPP